MNKVNLDSVRDSVRDSVWDSVRHSVRVSVGDSVVDSVWDSVGDSVWASVVDSVRDSVRQLIEENSSYKINATQNFKSTYKPGYIIGNIEILNESIYNKRYWICRCTICNATGELLKSRINQAHLLMKCVCSAAKKEKNYKKSVENNMEKRIKKELKDTAELFDINTANKSKYL